MKPESVVQRSKGACWSIRIVRRKRALELEVKLQTMARRRNGFFREGLFDALY